MKNIVAATFQPGYTTAKVLGLWQYDYGQILRIQGLELPDAVEIHFSLQEKGGESERQVGLTRDGVTEVAIPDSYLENAGTSRDYSIYAFLYISDGKSGNTEYKITMYVQSRPEPKDPETPEDPKDDPFGKTIEAVNKAMESTKASAEVAAESKKSASESATQAEKAKEAAELSAEAAAESKEAAGVSASNAAQSASQSRESATAAQTAADQATKSATAAAESETAVTQLAENATQSAQNASSSAESASQSAETAKTAADAASKSGSAAQQAAGSASESASTATAAAQTATTAAGNAAESVTSAAQSAETAGQKATAAETSANNATESATEAGKSATAAGDSASAAKASETAAGEAAQTAQEQADRIEESAEQIEKNKAGVAALEEKKADKTTLAVTERKLDVLWKLNQGVSYQFEEDSTEAYQKTVPSGAKLMSIKNISGKTIVWNQLIKNGESEKEMTCTDADDYVSYRADFDVPVVGRKYLVSFECYMERTDVSFLLGLGNYFASVKLNNISNAWTKISRIVTVTSIEIPHKFFYIYFNAVPRTMEVGDSVKVRNVEVFDLTKMFGSGNEPATVEEFEAMFPGEGYSYNAGELLSAGVNEIVERGRNLIDTKKVASKKGDVTFENLGNGKIHVYGSTDTRSEIDEIYVDEKDFPVGRYRINNTGNSGISITFVKKNKATGQKTWCNDKFEITDNDTPLYWYIMAVKCTVDTVITPQITKGNVEIPTLVYHNPVSFAVPEAVRQLPGYGWSAGDAYNEVDWEGKKYIQRVGSVDLGKSVFTQYSPENHAKHIWYTDISNMRAGYAKLACAEYAPHSWIGVADSDFIQGIVQSHPALSYIYIADDDYTNASDFSKAVSGVMLYYELAEPIITDISDIVDNAFQEPFEVESGGTLTFKNSHGDGFQIPVPNTEEYIVKLSEVAET